MAFASQLILGFLLLLSLIAPGALLHGQIHTQDDRLPLSSRIACWISLSAGLFTLLLLWLHTLQIRISAVVIWLFLPGSVLLLLWQQWQRRTSLQAIGQVIRQGIGAFGGVVVLGGATLALRLYQANDLLYPAWVDSLHHSLLIRIVVERGELPFSLEPYLPVAQIAYHWGLHALSGSLLIATNLGDPFNIPPALLLIGHVIGALIPICYAGAADYLWRRPAAGWIAGVVVGFISVMPAYYVSWGRYTLLFGMLLLPGCLILIDQIWQEPWRYRLVVSVAIGLIGLCLVHLVVCIFAGAWLVAVAIGRRMGWLRLSHTLGMLGGSIILGTAPWLVLLAGEAQIGSGGSATYVFGNSSYNALPFDLLWAGNNQWLLALACLSALLGSMLRHQRSAQIVIWCGLVVLLANPGLIGLPYLSFITNETMVVVLFAPTALLIAGGGTWIYRWIRRWNRLIQRILGIAVVLIGAGWGAWAWQRVIRSDTNLVAPDDRSALAWVADHTPTDGRFLVNSSPWLGTIRRGSDAGWWLLPVAGRVVSAPPVLYSYAEPDIVEVINRQSRWVAEQPSLDPQQLAAFMRAEGFGYIYTRIGQPLDPIILSNSASFEIIYQSGQVYILRLR